MNSPIFNNNIARFEIKGSLNSETYLDLLAIYIRRSYKIKSLDLIPTKRLSGAFWFRCFRNFSNNLFPINWIGINYPARSPDLAPFDFS